MVARRLRDFPSRVRPGAAIGWLVPSGRVVFAREHTSERWQGFMIGAVESGKRAAAALRALHALSASR